MKEQIKDYFQFTSRERKGIFLLICLITLLLVIFQNLDQWTNSGKDITINIIPAAEKVFEAPPKDYPQNGFKNDSQVSSPQSPTLDLTDLNLHEFNPNIISKEQLDSMNLPRNFIDKLLNFRNKGGKFFRSSDFKKLYGIDPDLMDAVLPFISIEEKKKPAPVTEKEFAGPLDLNSIGYRLLIKKFDLDTTFVKRFLKYRRDLGGFYSKEQVAQVEGFSETLCAELISVCIIDTTMINKIDLNEISTEELRLHPYFTGGIARAVVNYRIRHGRFISSQDLKKCNVFDDQLLKRILPYIIID